MENSSISFGSKKVLQSAYTITSWEPTSSSLRLFPEIGEGGDQGQQVQPQTQQQATMQGAENHDTMDIDLSSLTNEPGPESPAAPLAADDSQGGVGLEIELGSLSSDEGLLSPHGSEDMKPFSDVVSSQQQQQVAQEALSVEDQDLSNEIPYLFSDSGDLEKSSSQFSQSVSVSREEISHILKNNEGSSHQNSSEELVLIKKYLTIREQDLAILSAQLNYTKEELIKQEQVNSRLKLQLEDLAHQNHDATSYKQKLEVELSQIQQRHQEELSRIESDLRSRNEKIRILEEQNNQSEHQFQSFKDRVRTDVRKIKAREKELENKLEILRKDSETLIGARESKILELKRKLDLLEFNMDALQEQNELEKKRVSEAENKIHHVLDLLRIAIQVVEGSGDLHEIAQDLLNSVRSSQDSIKDQDHAA